MFEPEAYRYSFLTDRELVETLLDRIDIIVAVLLFAAGIAVAGIVCYIIYRLILRFF